MPIFTTLRAHIQVKLGLIGPYARIIGPIYLGKQALYAYIALDTGQIGLYVRGLAPYTKGPGALRLGYSLGLLALELGPKALMYRPNCPYTKGLGALSVKACRPLLQGQQALMLGPIGPIVRASRPLPLGIFAQE